MHNVFMVKSHPQGAQNQNSVSCHLPNLRKLEISAIFCKKWPNFKISVLVEMESSRLAIENFQPQVEKLKVWLFWQIQKKMAAISRQRLTEDMKNRTFHLNQNRFYEIQPFFKKSARIATFLVFFDLRFEIFNRNSCIAHLQVVKRTFHLNQNRFYKIQPILDTLGM